MICLCLIYREKEVMQSSDDGRWSDRWDSWGKLIEPLYATQRVLLDLGAGLEHSIFHRFPALKVDPPASSDLMISSMLLIEANDLEDARMLMCLHPDIDHSNESNKPSYLVIQPVHYLEMAQ